MQIIFPLFVVSLFLLALCAPLLVLAPWREIVAFCTSRRVRVQTLHLWKFKRSLKVRLREEGFSYLDVCNILEAKSADEMQQRYLRAKYRFNTLPCLVWDSLVYGA
jgi:hypothetical protein